MSIKIRPSKDRLPLSELDHIVTFPVELHFAREMVGYMQMAPDLDGTAMFMGKVFDQPEEDVTYPASLFDLRVRNGQCEITCPVLFAKGLLIAWAEQFMEQPMIVQVPLG